MYFFHHLKNIHKLLTERLIPIEIDSNIGGICLYVYEITKIDIWSSN